MKILNDKARFNYEIGQRLEAGIVLTGPEVKSVRLGQADMGNAHVKIQGSGHKGQHEAWLINLHIYPYAHADNTKYDPARTRKLLLNQKEIIALMTKMKQSRLLLVPTSIYTHSGVIKVELGLARGKKKYEKREDIKKRDEERDAQRRFS